MKKFNVITAAVVAVVTTWAGWIMANEEQPFLPNVDPKTGAISVPEDYTLWPTLGTWTHTKIDDGAATIHEYHVVYTQPETIEYYQKKRRFPDGAVIVKELLHAETMSMTTGPAVGHATTIKGFFVLVRDTKGRFKSSPLWGDGWGWSFYNADDRVKTVSTDYKVDCIPCHTPAKDLAPRNAQKDDKWIYTLGYPVLQKK
ncbi:cytochrome P460 family protein [Candidatus Nitronereus thalassa]|uniref:Cytochrome P460 family protein n=1 Tax=Candidatus Nitronereus thalassa TaxID=3020898 RepID=A0ABU3KB98_9BACT|nr:cytochrome P460 family protein [Candidatus Nitronereus thalassa]MDT7043622.1 cytochrome P460 family protein [Candidatus Nitronereus thalassa]